MRVPAHTSAEATLTCCLELLILFYQVACVFRSDSAVTYMFYNRRNKPDTGDTAALITDSCVEPINLQ